MEVDRLERGYYEELLTVDRFNSQLWEVYMNRPLDWLDVQGTGLARPTGDFLQRELIPSSTSYAYRVTIRTNRWGMRDRDYEKQPPPDTYRIAVLGASQVMGLGVEDNETFESLLEDHLNREHAGTPYAKYEILNFAAVAYKPLQQLMVLEKTFAFSPNAVFYVATHNDAGRAASYLAEVIRDKIDIPYEYLRELARRAGIDAETSETVAARRLRSFHDELLFWLYHSIVQACRDRGVLPVWVYMPMPTQQWPEEKIDTQIKQAEEAGFVTLNLRDAYKNQDENTLRLAEWDAHPNAAAHRLIATRLYEVLQEKRTLFFSRLSVHAGKP
jgi:lysophospholipase L1-like esterase